MSANPIEIAKDAYKAYVEKDRAKIEALIADDFLFTSPLDNGIDRKTYFERCWPFSEQVQSFDFIYAVQDNERVFLTYESTHKSGFKFRNTEIFFIRDGKIHAVEVYFGWGIPHVAKQGSFDNDALKKMF